ncbi:MAG: hypothetical protein QME60_08640 [Verrucomicrobiota bacterium]|nr:hypothetical protein [Verrucomicrobiota bacterium]
MTIRLNAVRIIRKRRHAAALDLSFVLIALAFCSPAHGQIIRCPATRDASISFHPEEVSFQKGGEDTMKIKFHEEVALMDFDVTALRGRSIRDAWLYVKAAGKPKFDLNHGTDLKWLSVATVAADWDERKASANSSGAGCWGWPRAQASDMSMGNANTVRCDGTLEPAGAWHRMRIDPGLVRALAAGVAYGFMVADGGGNVAVNSRIKSRESGEGPYLEVTVGANDKQVPASPRNVRVNPAPNWAGVSNGAVVLSVDGTAPDTFAYRIAVNGRPIPRWQIPLAVPGASQIFPLVDLPPDSGVKVEVRAVDAAGNVSATITASGRTSPSLAAPVLPAPEFQPEGGAPPMLGGAAIYAFPEVCKVHPVSGELLHEGEGQEFKRQNAIWSGKTRTIRLAAARGEIVSFQIGLDGKATGVRVEVSDLKGPSPIGRSGVRLWRNWYVNGQSEYALPWTGSVDCPTADNGVSGQKHQAVTVDWHIPAGVRPGNYEGRVTVSSAAERVELGLKVKVYGAVIPDEVFFNPELNCYDGPGDAGSEQFNKSFVLAHYHRCTINRVPYTQSARTYEDWVPKTDAQGRVTDWSGFDARLGGLLDGSLFKDNPRAKVPVPALYLPLSEGWPLDFKKYYSPGQGVPMVAKKNDVLLRHHALAKPIAEALAPEYKAAWMNAVRDFAKHARDKGWNRTMLECFLNRKPKTGYTLWTLDEPVVYRDWEALNFFAGLWKQAIGSPAVYTREWHERRYQDGLAALSAAGPAMVFRGDISRPQMQGNLSDGLMNLMIVCGDVYERFRTVRAQKERMPTILYTYGECNAYKRNNWESAAWCLQAFLHECDGLLPWQSLGEGLTNPDPADMGNALIVRALPYGEAIASFRVHALRRGAQDCELLRLLQLKRGWSRQHLGVLVSRKIPLAEGVFRQTFVDEAAAVTFGRLTSRQFCELKEGVLKLLEKDGGGQ